MMKVETNLFRDGRGNLNEVIAIRCDGGNFRELKDFCPELILDSDDLFLHRGDGVYDSLKKGSWLIYDGKEYTIVDHAKFLINYGRMKEPSFSRGPFTEFVTSRSEGGSLMRILFNMSDGMIEELIREYIKSEGFDLADD